MSVWGRARSAIEVSQLNVCFASLKTFQQFSQLEVETDEILSDSVVVGF